MSLPHWSPPERKWRWNPPTPAAASLLAGIMLAFACASPKPKHEHQTAQPTVAAAPPVLISGPVSVLLTNEQDFSARVTFSENRSAGVTSADVNGNLFQQRGRILFVPMAKGELGPGRGAGAFRFLWDLPEKSAYIICEALRGYAPVAVRPHYWIERPSAPVDPISPERIEEQPCRQELVQISSSEGKPSQFRVWRAVELNDLPLRILSWPDTNQVSVQLSDVTAEAQTPDLFALPPTYIPFPNAQAMARELVRKPRVLPYSSGDSSRARGR